MRALVHTILSLPAAVAALLLLAPAPAQAGGRVALGVMTEAGAAGPARPGVGFNLGLESSVVGALGSEVFLGVDVGGFRSAPARATLLFDVGLGGRITTPLGVYLDARAGMGYLHGLVESADGGLEGQAFERRNLAPFGAVGLGLDLDTLSPLPLALYARATGYAREPLASDRAYQLTGQAGLVLHF